RRRCARRSGRALSRSQSRPSRTLRTSVAGPTARRSSDELSSVPKPLLPAPCWRPRSTRTGNPRKEAAMNPELLFPRIQQTPVLDDATINGLMDRFVTGIAASDPGAPLTLRLPLLAIWGTLHHLTGDASSYWDAACFVMDFCDDPAGVRPLSPAGRAVASAFV